MSDVLGFWGFRESRRFEVEFIYMLREKMVWIVWKWHVRIEGEWSWRCCCWRIGCIGTGCTDVHWGLWSSWVVWYTVFLQPPGRDYQSVADCKNCNSLLCFYLGNIVNTAAGMANLCFGPLLFIGCLLGCSSMGLCCSSTCERQVKSHELLRHS